MQSNGTRQRELAGKVARNYAIGVLVIAALFWFLLLLDLIVQAIAFGHSNNAVSNKPAEAAFWKIVAGGTPTTSDPSVKLAIDLNAMMGPTDPTLKVLPSRFDAFAAPYGKYASDGSNFRYSPLTSCYVGGNSQAGSVNTCGMLLTDAKTTILQIQQGHLDAVLKNIADTTPVPGPGYSLMPFGLTVWSIFPLAFLLASPLALMSAVAELNEDYGTYDFRLINLSWYLFDGDAVGYKLVSLIIGAPILVPFLTGRCFVQLNYRRRLRHHAQLKTYVDTAQEAVLAARKLSRRNPRDPQVAKLKADSDRLMRSINDKGNTEAIAQQLRDTLDGLDQINLIAAGLSKKYPVGR